MSAATTVRPACRGREARSGLSRWRGAARPASLRGRVVVTVLVLLAVLLIALFVAVDLALGARLRGDLRTRLTDRVALAEQLDGALSAQQLVNRLSGDGVQIQLCSATTSSSLRCVSPVVAPAPRGPGGAVTGPGGEAGPAAAGPGAAAVSAAPAAAAASFTRDGSTLYARATLAHTGQVLSLSVDGSEITSTLRGLVVAEVVGGLAALIVAAVVLGRLVGVALRPLDDMSRLARRIAGGDRGRRLQSAAPNTELGRTADAFDAMLDELEAALTEADDARERLQQFLGDATHELRSPLAGVRARAELLLRDDPPRHRRETACVAIIREADRASRLVNDLLTAAALEQHPTNLLRDPVDLVAVAREEAERLRLRPGAPQILEQGGRAVVAGDRQRLAQIVGNLLDNAARAARSTIYVRVHHVDDHYVLEVCDDGPGVPEADRERIFERLVRLDTSRARDTGGSGLGLPIARGLARAHGGDVAYRSSGPGACFRLTLPAANVTRAVAAPARSC